MAEYQRQSASSFIVDELLDRIRRGELRPGERLAPERELAVELGVSRVPLREAVSALSMLGILTPRQGAGTYVGAYDPQIMGKVSYAYAVLEGTTVQEVLAVRRALETEAARLAALHARPEHVTALEQAVNDHTRAMGNPPGTEAFLAGIAQADRAFHDAVAQASGNRYLIQQLATVSATYEELCRHSGSVHGSGSFAEAQYFLQCHARIYRAIRAHMPGEAQNAMREHGERVEELANARSGMNP